MSSGEGPSQPSSKKSKQPKYSRFTQQELPACKPILTPGLVVTIFIVVGVVFIPIGLASLSASERVVEIVDRYDEDCVPAGQEKTAFIQNPATNKTCTRNLRVPKKMKKPIYIYYQLDNFYQNHRRYVKSRSDKQLRSPKDEDVTSTCDPEGRTTVGDKPIVPCGLVAWSLFNDTYGFYSKNEAVTVNKKDIAWGSDKNYKFGSNVYPKNFQSGGLIGGGKLDEKKPLSEQEDLLVWMRTAALPSFRKLYGRIEQDLEPNEQITVVIENNYNAYAFGGKKKLVLSTTTWIGGKNSFLGLGYITVGGLCLFFAAAFIVMYLIKPRPFADPSYLSWNRFPNGS
ncbi:OLC1v1025768C1 [Oldenlandia corymbosa var. corymbosa]|uniref:ALA-interacting subunit n=1 Tax=Oldenlandia corymbosa var. corymbosa TaxID=529605 RepID=A0AAV1C6D7_OLDCO|nr:OLC1v1025768C1 [Oldenlandia corymbosa var. corymbosa]